MGKTFDSKINELEQEKSELDLSFLEWKKQEYQERIKNILENPTEWEDEKEKLDEVRECYKKMKEIEYKITHKDEIIKAINNKLDTYNKRKNKARNIPLYRNTEEWINEILWEDKLYQYAKETNDKELIQKLEERTLTPTEYSKFSEKMYKELFAPLLKKKNKQIETQQKPKVIILLPEWMKEKIKEILNDKKEFTINEIENFLKNELKKNSWEIKLSHIKNIFKDRADKALIIIEKIISDFSEFKIIDNSEEETKSNKTKKSKRDKLIASINPNSQQWKEATKGILLREIYNVWNETILEKRMELYIDILEKLWHKFSDKELFKKESIETIESHTSIQIEEGLKKAIIKIIGWTITLMKKNAFGYRDYEMGWQYDNWRIVLYPNKEIMKICSHPEYESIIDSRPPSDKR